MIAMPLAFKYSEVRLAMALGISRADFKSLRDDNLSVGVDWEKNGGGEVALSTGGLKKIWRVIGQRPRELDLRECLAGQKKNGTVPETDVISLGETFQPIPEKMRVTRICENPSVVLAADQHSRIQSIFVGRNANFVIGMKLTVVPYAAQPGWWRLLGPPPQRRYTPDEWNRRQELYGGRL